MAGKYIAVDLSDAVLLYRFQQFLRRLLLLLLVISRVLLLMSHSTVVLLPLILVALSAAAARYFPHEWLRRWIQLSMVVTIAQAWIFWKLAKLELSRMEGSSAALLVLTFVLAVFIVVFFWVCRRVLTRQELTPDEGFILDASTPFATEPLLADIWLSGGLRTASILLCFGFVFFVICLVPPFAFLAAALASVLAVPWILLPVHRGLKSDFPTRLLRAIESNRSRAPHESYGWFVWRKVYKRLVAAGSISLLWVIGSGLLLVGAVWWVWWVFKFGIYGELDPRLIPAYVLGFLAMFCYYKSGWHFRRPLTLYEAAEDMSGLDVVKLALLKEGSKSEWLSDLSLSDLLKQPFILYLRSFSDDPVEVHRDGLTPRLLAINERFDKYRFVSLEKVIADTVWRFGKVVALGEPGHAATSSGARPEAILRVVVGNDWQKYAGDWIREAQYVLMTVGGTHSLKWEFQHLVQSGALGKLTLILRHNKPAEMAYDWRELCSDSSSPIGCPDQIVARSVAVRFSDGNLPIFLAVSHRYVASYKVALNTCLLPRDQLLDCIRSARSVYG